MGHHRIVRIAGLQYQQAGRAFYAQDLGLAQQPYAEQQRRLFEQAYVYSDSFSRVMRELGHEAYELVYDLEILQKTWAREQGVTYQEKSWQADILWAQLKQIQPEVVYFQDIHSLPYRQRRDLKRAFPSIRLVVAYKGYPGAFHELDDLDMLLVSTPTIAEQYRAQGLKAELVYHCFDEAIGSSLQPTAADEPRFDFTFLGSSGFGYGFDHQARFWMLVALLKQKNLEAWVDEINQSHFLSRARHTVYNTGIRLLKHVPDSALADLFYSAVMPRGLTQYRGMLIPTRPLRRLFPRQCHGPLFGLPMYDVLRRSKVTFNKHASGAENSVGNIRLFQATGVGTCLLTDTGINLADLFEADREVVTYSSLPECLDKVTYLLTHERERQQIAAAGQARTLREHTVQVRYREIENMIQQKLSSSV